MKSLDENNVHKGHRARMRAKFLRHGSGIFDTYELLEMLLYVTVKRSDTNPLSKRLLDKFGSLEGVLSASREELLSTEGIGERTADYLISVGGMSELLAMDCERFNAPLLTYDEIAECFVKHFNGGDEFAVSMMLLDNSMNLVDLVDIAECDFNSGRIVPAPFIHAAIKSDAALAVLAHTHPHGPDYPSYGDIESNNMINESLADAGVELIEHYVVCGDVYRGFMDRKIGLLSQFTALRGFYESKLKRGLEAYRR